MTQDTKAGDAAFNPATATITISVGKKAVVFKARNVSVHQGHAMPAFTYVPVTLAAGNRAETEPTAACTATVAAVIAGNATITVTTADGGKTANCIVTVEKKTPPPAQYSITIQGGIGGTASASPTSATAGTKITLIATPNRVYQFKEWQVISGDVTVDNGTVQSAINTAKNDAKKNGNTANGVAVVIPITPKEGQNSFNVPINAQTLNTLVHENMKRMEINIEGVAVGGMDTKLLKWLDTLSANGDVIFRVKQTDPSGLFREAKAAIGTRPVYDLSLVYLSGGKETPITDFDGHTIAVRLPYAPAKEELAGNLYAVYVDGKGKVEWLTKSSYDSDLGTVIFETGHFSIYCIGYKNPAPAFTDIKNHWAEDNIIFVASRGLLTGTGNNQSAASGTTSIQTVQCRPIPPLTVTPSAWTGR